MYCFDLWAELVFLLFVHIFYLKQKTAVYACKKLAINTARYIGYTIRLYCPTRDEEAPQVLQGVQPYRCVEHSTGNMLKWMIFRPQIQ